MPTTSSRLNSPAPRPTVAAISRQYATWTAWVESGDWRETTKTGRLALPANASDIMVLALDPDVSVAQLVHVTSRDQVLAARMLRLANSAYCGAMEEITTINEAVVRLGTASVRNVVLATCMASRLQQGAVYGPLGRGLADHGIGSAFLGQAVARHVGADAEEAFLYCLVHDLGKLLVLQLAKDFTAAAGRLVRGEEVAAMIALRHADFGGQVLEEWRLPLMVQRPVVYHHRPENAPDHKTEVAVAYAANRLAHRYGFGCPATPEEELAADGVFVQLGLSESWLANMDAKAPDLMEGGQAAFA
jgi:HD-like signal output (HDOD) protein